MKVDLRKEWKHLYNPPAKECVIVDVPEMNFIMIDGSGNPNTSQEFKDAIEALYSVAYTLKFMIKKGEKGIDYAVMPLEGIWWTDNMSEFSTDRKDDWKWTLMIMQPEYVTVELFEEAAKQVGIKKKLKNTGYLRFEAFKEGLSAQIMHRGSFADEGPTVKKLHEFIKGEGCVNRGKHREIYLSDPGRTAPEKMKTVIRQPMIKIGGQ